MNNWPDISAIFPGKDQAEQDNILSELTSKYPYFSIGHILAYRQSQAAGKSAEDLAGRAVLFNPDPWFLSGPLPSPGRPGEPVHAEPAVSHQEVVEDISVDNNPDASPADISNNQEEADIEEKEIPIVPLIPASDLVFEPLYTTDYFASQGIKISQEVQPADKLGKQLKSFTEWLKTMKKVHEPGNPAPETAIDSTVQHLAEKSNREEIVLTEAMAEVYAEQGKARKAREIYEKLSLLNPAKSAYFAAKIEQLNNA